MGNVFFLIDSDGLIQMVQLTLAAKQEIDRLRRRQNQPDAICRLALQPSSCAQWAYVLSFEAATTDISSAESSDSYEFDGLRLVVQPEQSEYIKDLVIDFTEDLTGGAFRFANSLATESCRCGYAFTIG